MSLRLRLALIGTMLLALLLGLVTFYTLDVLRTHFESQQQARVRQLQPLLNAALAAPLIQRDYASVQAILEESLQGTGLQRLQAYDASGRLVASAPRTTPPAGSGGQATRPQAGPQTEVRADLTIAGQAIGSVIFTLSHADLELTQARITRYLLIVGALALLFFSALLWVLSGTVTRRLQRLVQASHSIRRGEYAPALPAVSKDELGILVQAFATMSGEIRRKVDELNALNEGLEQQVAQRTRDLTARTIELDHSVRALQTRSTALDMAPFGILMMDPDGARQLRIRYANRAFCEGLAYAPDTICASEPGMLFGEATDAQAREALASALREHRRAEVELLTQSGRGESRLMRWLVFPSRDADGAVLSMVACLTDVTEMRQHERERQRMASELQESSKLESLGLAIAGIAHDLNTPIGVAVTAATVAQQSSEQLIKAAQAEAPVAVELRRLADRVGKSAELISRNLARAAQLVRSFKQTSADVSRLEWRHVNLFDLLDSLRETMSPVMRRAGCEVILNCPPRIELWTEPGALSQAITNLMVNATLHAFQGIDQPRLTIEVTEQPDTVTVAVADNGQGMTQEASAQAFTPFFTTRRAQGGSGLGLFSSHRAVERVLGGRIDFETAPGRGTRFIIALPRQAHDAETGVS